MFHLIKRSIPTITLTTLLSFFIGTSVVSAENKMVPLPQNLEIELALSALPSSLREGATILTLNPTSGYETFRKGSNGFVTFVARTSVRFYQAKWNYKYPKDQLIPIAFDEVGSEIHLKPWLDIAKMRAEGVPPALAKKQLQESFANGTYKAPVKGGISYMLAPIHRAYLAPEKSGEIFTTSFPHYMPYAPNVSAAQIGNEDPTKGAPIALTHGHLNSGPHGYLVFMLPEKQIKSIRSENKELLTKLCKLNSNWCISEKQ